MATVTICNVVQDANRTLSSCAIVAGCWIGLRHVSGEAVYYVGGSAKLLNGEIREAGNTRYTQEEAG